MLQTQRKRIFSTRTLSVLLQSFNAEKSDGSAKTQTELRIKGAVSLLKRTLFDKGCTDFPSQPLSLKHVSLCLQYCSDLIKRDFNFDTSKNTKVLI